MTDRGNFIYTFTGRKFYFLDPRPEDICLEDIAHALSNLCRYTGHGKFYSVAEHSVHVTNYLALTNTQVSLLQAALLHDATEAYVGDMSKPLKTLLPAYDEIESRVADAVAKRFGLQPDPRIKHADLVMLATELPKIINYTESTGGANDWLSKPWLECDLMCLAPPYAERMFLNVAAELGLA